MKVIFNKKKLMNLQCEMDSLHTRIHELEEILCPCSQHDFIDVSSKFVLTDFAQIVDGFTEHTMMCKKCKKVMRTGNPVAPKYY